MRTRRRKVRLARGHRVGGAVWALVLVVWIAPSAWRAGAVASPVASVAERERQARRLFQKARADFDAGAFDVAAGEFEAGYALTPLPLFLYNAAQAHRRAGHDGRAEELFRRYLVEVPAATERVEIETWLKSRVTSPPPLVDAVPTPQLTRLPEVQSRPAPKRTGLIVGLSVGGAVVLGGVLALGLAFGLPHSPPSSDLGNLRPFP